MPIQRPKSIVEQVTVLLRQRIHDQVYPPGGRLPSESELAQEMGVSRATIRTVLAKFAAEGLILRKQGDGTYVNERIRDIDTQYGGMWDFSRLIEANGFEPMIRTESLDIRPSSPTEAKALSIEAEKPVVALTRLFLADGHPAIFATNVLPASLMNVGLDELDGSQPIHKIVQVCCDQNIAYAISDIEATLVDEALRQKITMPQVNKPLLKLIETFYNRDNRPLVSGVSFFDHTTLKLRLVQAWG